MKISYLLWEFGYTGGSQVLYRFMNELSGRGHEVYAITPYGALRWEPRSHEEILKPAIGQTLASQWVKAAGKALVRRVPILGQAMQKRLKQSVWDRVERLVRNWVPADVTIATFCMTAFAAYRLMDCTVPAYHMQHYEELFFRDDEQRMLARLTYFLPLQLMANSKWLQTQIESRFQRHSWLLNPGVDTEIFRPVVDPSSKYGRMSRLRILSYADDRPFKGWADACRAMELVFRRLGEKRVEWIVFGGGKAETSLPVSRVGKVFGRELAQLYSSAHIVFMPSWYESFPLPPLEAMACGTAVITTRGGTEDYADHMLNAWVVEPRKPELLAEAIIELGSDPALMLRLAQAGVETARRFTWAAAVAQLEAILSQAVISHRSSQHRFADVCRLVTGQL